MEYTQEEKIERYRDKCRMVGIEPLGLELIEGYVVLSNITKVGRVIEVPGFVDIIQAKAFQSLEKVREVIIHGEEMYINGNMFVGVRGLIKIRLPRRILFADDELKKTEAFKGYGRFHYGEETVGIRFSNCIDLQSIELPETLENIKDDMFYGCSLLKRIQFPKYMGGVIGDGAFFRCRELRELKIPDGIKSIGNRAFGECTKLERVRIPRTVKSIENRAFDSCHSMSEITLRNGLESIGNSAFSECRRLRHIIIPDSVVNIGDSLFKGSSELDYVKLGKGVGKDDSEFDINQHLGVEGGTTVYVTKELKDKISGYYGNINVKVYE